MVMQDGPLPTNAGQDTLAPAAIARHQMMHRGPNGDHLAAHRQRVHPDRGTETGVPQIRKRPFAVVADHFHLLINLFRRDPAQLLLALAPVGASATSTAIFS